jgi:hypothetical protein
MYKRYQIYFHLLILRRKEKIEKNEINRYERGKRRPRTRTVRSNTLSELQLIFCNLIRAKRTE